MNMGFVFLFNIARIFKFFVRNGTQMTECMQNQIWPLKVIECTQARTNERDKQNGEIKIYDYIRSRYNWFTV